MDPKFIFYNFFGSGFGFSINFEFGSGFSINFGSRFGSGLFMKNTLEFILLFLKALRILHSYLNCRSSNLQKANFYGSSPDPTLIRDSDPDSNLQII